MMAAQPGSDGGELGHCRACSMTPTSARSRRRCSPAASRLRTEAAIEGTGEGFGKLDSVAGLLWSGRRVPPPRSDLTVESLGD